MNKENEAASKKESAAALHRRLKQAEEHKRKSREAAKLKFDADAAAKRREAAKLKAEAEAKTAAGNK